MSSKITLSLKDRAFGHSPFSNNPPTPVSFSEHVVWDRVTPPGPKTIYTDAEIFTAPDGVIAWLIEPIHGRPDAYEFLLKRAPGLREIWTNDRALLEQIPNGRFVPFGGCWIPPAERWLWPKSKGVSMIVSNKRGGIGYDLRHETVARLGSKIDAYGVDYMPLPIEWKIGGLRDYRFQIVIENVRCDWWFTEKLIDCFATGTIPIYWGCPHIGRFFNEYGILQVGGEWGIGEAVNSCTPELYDACKDAIADNFDRAKKYYLAEDWLYANCRELLEELAIA